MSRFHSFALTLTLLCTLALAGLLNLSASNLANAQFEPSNASIAAPNACTPLSDADQIPNPNLINFDDLEDGTTIGTYYQEQYGVVFEDGEVQRAEAVSSVLAHSRLNVAINQAVPPNEGYNSPLLIQFESLQSHVGFFVGGSGDSGLTAVLRAYNENGDVVCAYDIEPVPDPLTLFMGVYDPNAQIASVTLDYGDTAVAEAIDDLIFTSSPPAATATPTSLPPATKTPTKTTTPTPKPPTLTPTKTPTPQPTKTPIPVTDLIADELEITQGIQDLDNSVILVAGKRTFVRFYSRSTGGGYLTIARLKLQKGNQTTYVLPIAPGGPYLKVTTAHLRLLPGHAFLFELPAGFRDGTVTITAEVNFTNPIWRATPNPFETNYANNLISRTVTFKQVPTLPVVIASQPYQPAAAGFDEYWPTFTDQWRLYSWIKRAYPVNKIQLYLRTLPVWPNATRKWVPNPNGPGGAWNLTYPNCGAVNITLEFNKAAIINSWFYHKNIHLVGLVNDGYGFMRGCAGTTTASGPAGSDDWGWDFDGSYADWYGGHELGHTYGFAHTLGTLPKGCGEKGTVKQYANGLISPTADLFNRQAIYGFDPFFLDKNPVLGPDWHDMMTYCDRQWLSDITYNGLFNIFKFLYGTNQTAGFVPDNQAQLTDRLAVYGAVDLQTKQISSLLPMFVWFNSEDIEPRIPGPYAIVLLDSQQKELARYPFTPDGSDSGASPQGGEGPQFAAISELVPYVPGTVKVNIEGPGHVLLASVTAGSAAPTVKLLSPNGGELLDNESITVNWTAVDADNDPLSFNLYFSPDNGSSWDPLAMAITGNQISLDSNMLAGSSSALLRIEASDGMHTAGDTSDAPFTVPNHPPSVTIFTPDHDVTIAADQTLGLEAFAYDPELGLMDDTLLWSSSLDGELGYGSQFSTAGLSVGVHLITALADDGQGGTAEDSITVTVVSTPDDLPPVADALLVAPDQIILYAAGGVVSTMLGVENQNPLNDIPWQVASDQTWVKLDSNSGTTPALLTASVDTEGLAPGIHHAVLAFSQQDGGEPESAVPLTLIIEPYSVYLPGITR